MDDAELAGRPANGGDRELWLQHAAGFILLRDVRGYARARLASDLSPEARAAAVKGIDDALYGLMMVLDGVTGALANDAEQVELEVRIQRRSRQSGEVLESMTTTDGDGMCMAVHGWLQGDFGDSPPFKARC